MEPNAVADSNSLFPVAEDTASALPYAGFWLRFLASLIDLLSALFVFAIGFFIDLFDEDPFVSQTNQVAIFLLIAPFFYFPIMECLPWQGTLGKKLVRIKVTDMNGGKISLGKGLKRFLSKFLSFAIAFGGFIMVAFTDKRQALHDKVAGTLVLRNQPARQ